MARGAQAAQAADPPNEKPVRASAGPARRDLVDAVPKERRNGLAEIPAERLAD